MANHIVDPLNGSDPSSGLTESTAWKTLKKASDSAMPGDAVHLRGGIYLPNDGNAGLRTKRNGLAGAPIIFCAYQSELPILKHQYLGVAVEHSFITLRGLGVINDTDGIMESGICHWENHGAIRNIIVEDCIVRNVMPNDPRHGIRLENLTYGIIRRNTVDHIGTPPQPGPEGGNGLWITGHYNLIEENKTDYCGHAGIFVMGDRVVVRRNDCNGTWGVPAEYLCYGTTAYRSLVEDNIFRNAAYLQDGLWRNPAWEQMGSGTIFRRNRLYRSVGTGVQIYSRSDYQSWHNRYYHNVIYECGGVPPPSYLCAPYEIQEDVAGTQGDNISKNNIHFLNKRNDRATFAGTGNQAVIAFLSNTWNDTDPLFVDAPNGNFRLRPGSPAINAGEFLTRTAVGGSGRALSVLDAKYFCDGWGIVEGDYIQLEGSDLVAQVLAIDYAQNRISIDRDLSWLSGQGISLPFIGSKPDKGAFEYIGENMAITHSLNILLKVTDLYDFTPVSVPVQGETQRTKPIQFKISFTPVGTFNKTVKIALKSGLPTAATYTIVPEIISSGQEATLTVTPGAASPLGDANLSFDLTEQP